MSESTGVRVTTEAVKALREKTGAGIMDCKRALEDARGDMEKAQALLKEKGLAKAAARAGRVASQGLIESYLHAGGRVGAMVELNCETDFVARTEEFRYLAHELAMQVAAMNPTYVSVDDMPEDPNLRPEEVCLLSQAYIRDPSRTVGELLLELAASSGENIRVRRFARFELGS